MDWAALGLTFSKPLIDTIRPKPAFAAYHDSVGGSGGTTGGSNLCTVAVTLVKVHYYLNFGIPVGNEWEYDVTVQGQSTHFPQRTLNQGGVDEINQQVYFGTTGVCSSTVGIDITVSATEIDPIYNDVGSNNLTVSVECPHAPDAAPEGVVVVLVQENPTSGATPDVALLYFYFDIVATCDY